MEKLFDLYSLGMLKVLELPRLLVRCRIFLKFFWVPYSILFEFLVNSVVMDLLSNVLQSWYLGELFASSISTIFISI